MTKAPSLVERLLSLPEPETKNVEYCSFRHHQDQSGPEVLQHAGMRPDPVRDLLGERGLGMREIARSRASDEQLHLPDLARLQVHDLRPLARPVRERLLAGRQEPVFVAASPTFLA